MLPGIELMGCSGLAVPAEVMHHVVRVESSYNPYAIGVVGGRLARQPRSLGEAVSTARMLEQAGYNFSLGLAQVNRHNLTAYGLDSHERAFDICPNLRAGARILSECYTRAGRDWGKALSCYYSGNFVTGFRHGYVQKVLASWSAVSAAATSGAEAIPFVPRSVSTAGAVPGQAGADAGPGIVARRVQEAAWRPQHAAGAAPPDAGGAGLARGEAVPSAAPVPQATAAQGALSAVEPVDDSPVRVQRVTTPLRSGSAMPPVRTGAESPPATVRADAAFVF